MVIFTAKVNKKRLIALGIIILVVLGAVYMALHRGSGQDEPQLQTSVSVKGVKDNDDRLAYINSLGYTVDAQPLNMEEVLIPKKFDETYAQYNKMQKDCGFDLEKYQGKRVKLYTYGVTEYQGAQDVRLDLLVYKNRIIGGGVYTTALDGFMSGLAPYEAAPAKTE